MVWTQVQILSVKWTFIPNMQMNNENNRLHWLMNMFLTPKVFLSMYYIMPDCFPHHYLCFPVYYIDNNIDEAPFI